MRLLLLVLLALAPPALVVASPAFEQTGCDMPGVTPDLAPRLRCGAVHVPRNPARAAGPGYVLAVVIIRPPTPDAKADPVLYISGGPGSPLTQYAVFQARHPYAPDRDLILVDQRGTGRSEPRLCPKHGAALLDLTLQSIIAGSDDATAQLQAAYAACRTEAEAAGNDLADFGTQVTAEDLETVRQALGVTRWNVYGESYGTTVAMTLAALHPAPIRTLVLDSLYPPDPAPSFADNVRDARAAFFANCAENTRCDAAYPRLAATYAETLDHLAQEPLPMPPDLPGPLTASLFEPIIGQLLYLPSAYKALPRLINSVHDGHTEPLIPYLRAILASARSTGSALHAAVECRDRPHLRAPLPRPPSGLDSRLNGICADWALLGPPPLVPRGTTIPVLVLAGQFDPVARPATSRSVAEDIGPAARWIEFPRMGHNLHAFSACAVRIAAAFIDDPARSLDARCVATEPAIPFE